MDISTLIRANNYHLVKQLLDQQLVDLHKDYDTDIVDSNNPQLLDILEKRMYRTFNNTSLFDGQKGDRIVIHVMKTHIRRSINSCELLRLACCYSETFFAEEFIDICDEPDIKQLQLLTDNPEILQLLHERKEPVKCCFFKRK